MTSAIELQAQPTDLADPGDLLAAWKTGVHIEPVSADANAHSIHAYFNTCPESPDGRYVIFFHSTAADGQFGDIYIKERATKKERVLVKDVHTEDAHRVAAQQWVANGKYVAFQDQRNGEWMSVAINVETGEQKILAKGRLVGFGLATGDVVPLYGPHWAPGEHRDLELVNVLTGEISTVVTNQAVRETYPDSIAKTFGTSPTSIFFPEISPDGKRVFFKMSAVKSGEVRTADASTRDGLIMYDMAQKKFIRERDTWGHPYWCPDSKSIIEVQSSVINLETGEITKIPGMPHFSGSHPSISADGRFYLTDMQFKVDNVAKEWGVVVADMKGTNYVVIDRFDAAGGATSWRPPHPHPVFNADGKRVYFNVNSGPWTRLFVAEASPSTSK